MTGDVPSGSEIAAYFLPLVKQNINAEILSILQRDMNAKICSHTSKHGDIGQLSWKLYEGVWIVNTVQSPYRLSIQGAVKVKGSTPHILAINYSKGGLQLSIKCKYELDYFFMVIGYDDSLLENVTGKIECVSPIDNFVGDVPLSLFRLWMHNQLYDETLGIPKPDSRDSMITYGNRSYPVDFIRLIRKLGTATFEKFLELGIMASEEVELVTETPIQDAKSITVRMAAIKLPQYLLKRLEEAKQAEGQVLSYAEWGLLWKVKSTAARQTLRNLGSYSLIDLTKSPEGTSLHFTEKGMEILKQFNIMKGAD